MQLQRQLRLLSLYRVLLTLAKSLWLIWLVHQQLLILSQALTHQILLSFSLAVKEVAAVLVTLINLVRKLSWSALQALRQQEPALVVI